MIRRSIGAGVVAALATAAAVALPLGAHVERDPFFVDPAPDTSVLPAAGGDFVEVRELGDPAERLPAFLDDPGRAPVVERFARLSAAQQTEAREHLGEAQSVRLGLTDPRITAEETLVVCRPDSLQRLEEALAQVDLGAREGALRSLNVRFAELCRFGEIQPAVDAADNGDTVVVMPGFYTEPTSRAQPHNDPRCADLSEQGSRSQPAPTYEYHFTCPNDLNLVAVLGRSPDDGKCLRCNVALIGSGARPEDVVVEVGEGVDDPGVTGDLFEERRGRAPGAKEVGIRLERADGAVVSHLTVRNANEHGVYSIEADGVTFDRLRAYYNREYGHLSFVTDHLVVQDGDFAGSGDAGIYPGASPPSGPRLNSVIRRNRSHHNALGLSGSMGSSLHIVDNDFDRNATGIVLDSISRRGHPGFPQNSTRIERNRIFANNFDVYGPGAWVRSTIQAPIGAGIIFAGGNDNVVFDNDIYDNWKWGTALITVPDAVANDGPKREDVGRMSTSHRNRVVDNRFGRAPGGAQLPNGVDHWWDELGEANCWERNSAPGGIVSDPSRLPTCTQFPNIGTGNPLKTRELLDCNFVSRGRHDSATCDWFRVPPRPERRR